MFILSCSAALAFGLFPFAAGQSVAFGDRGKMETAPRPGLECLQVTLLIRQMVLDRYDTTGTGILSEQDKARLVEDARSARREARKAFLRKFDKDGDGRLSPEEYRAFFSIWRWKSRLLLIRWRCTPAPCASSGPGRLIHSLGGRIVRRTR